MTMTTSEPPKDDASDRFEERLRGFRPVAPRALALTSQRTPWRALAVAAAVFVAIGASIVPILHRHSGGGATVADTTTTAAPSASAPPRITLGNLNAALRGSDEDIARMLDDASPRLLPRAHRGTALFELGKE